MDGTLSEGELKTNTQAKESGIETLSDTPNQKGGSDGVFFMIHRLHKWVTLMDNLFLINLKFNKI